MAQRTTLAIPNPLAPNQDVNVGSQTPNGIVGFPVTEAPSSGSNVTNVPDSATSVLLLAANPNRTGSVFTNTSSAILYVKLAGTQASENMFTYRLPQNATQEVLFPYTGAVTGMWATDNNDGFAVITEFVK